MPNDVQSYFMPFPAVFAGVIAPALAHSPDIPIGTVSGDLESYRRLVLLAAGRHHV
jgi:hypothetical protein